MPCARPRSRARACARAGRARSRLPCGWRDGGGGGGVADLGVPLRARRSWRRGPHLGGELRVGAGRAPRRAGAGRPGVRASSSREASRAGLTGAQLPGGAAGAAQPGAGDRAGEDLHDGVLPGGEAAAGGGEGPQRVRAWSVLRGRISVRASRSVPPVASAPAGSGGLAGAVTAWAPGQAASMARSTMPGGTVPGTHILIVIPAPPAQVYSKPRCGWPCHSRAHGGRSSPVRCPHSAWPPAGSASGGAST